MIQTITSENVTAKIETNGAELMSFAKAGKEYLWQGNPEFWEDRAPVLFPVVGRSKDEVLNIKGKDYPMPGHGFARHTEMNIVEKTENSVTLHMTQSKKTKEYYPWDFAFTVTYTLEGSKLTTAFRVENCDDEPMLFGLGGHPGFHLPMHAGEKFEDYCLEFEQEEVLWSNQVLDNGYISATQKNLLLDSGRVLPLKRALFNHDAIIFEDIKSHSVNLIHKDTRKGIHFTYNGFQTFASWTREEPCEGATFLCLEPWISMGIRDDEGYTLEEKYGIQTLNPGEVFTASFSAEIID